MKLRIVSNGKVFRIEKKYFFWGWINICGEIGFKNEYKRKIDAIYDIRKMYGINALINDLIIPEEKWEIV